MTRLFRFPVWLGAAAIASVVCLAACASSARFETTGGGHPVVAFVTGPHRIDSRDTHATISTPSAVVTVERTRTRVDDGPWTTIPERVPVRIDISTHTVSIRAGSVTVSRTMR